MNRTLGARTNQYLNIPNAITLSGYVSTIGWLVTDNPVMGFYGLLADEIDGRVARASGEVTRYGSMLDWAVDLTLTGAVAYKAKMLWALPVITPYQVYIREKGESPPIGSARAILTVIALIEEQMTKKKNGNKFIRMKE